MTQNLQRQSENNLSNFFKMPVGVHWVGPDGTILKATRYELEMLGYSPDELVGQNIAKIHVDEEAIDDILQKIKVGVELLDYKTQLRCKDGSVRHVLINSEVERENGEYIHTRFFVRDITERGYSELSNALLAAIIDNSNDAIISKDLNGIISSWNDSAERIFGYTATEAIGQSITLIIPDERLDEEKKILNRLKRGERVDHFETIREHKDGTKLNISLNISPIKDSEGRIVGASKIARDITKRKEAEANLISYQEQLRSLASKLSKAEEQERLHLATELHDNLGQLLSMSKMKLNQLGQKSFPESLRPELDELEDLINEANSYTRELMSELKPPPTLEKKHFGTALDWIANKMKQHNLEVAIEDDEQVKPLNQEVQTVFLQSIKELLFNVVKHAGVDKARVIISRRADKIQAKIIDEGRGFDMDKKELAPSGNGGFGLFNIKERMDLLGGDLEIYSEPEKGTTVKLTAPLKEEQNSVSNGAEKQQTEPAYSPTAEEQNRKIKVLLVDDHQIMREGIRNLIEAEDDMMVVAEASGGNEAVELAEETSPDVIIMDINMPGMNGIEATKKILSDNTQPIVIGLSVHNSEDVKESVKNVGASVYLSKTEAFELLCATIRCEMKTKERD